MIFFKIPQLCGFFNLYNSGTKVKERLVKFFKTQLVKFLKLVLFEKPSENAYDLSKFLATILYSQVHMSAAESLGSHQLNSFAAFLEEKLHTSSETSIVQNPQ